MSVQRPLLSAHAWAGVVAYMNALRGARAVGTFYPGARPLAQRAKRRARKKRDSSGLAARLRQETPAGGRITTLPPVRAGRADAVRSSERNSAADALPRGHTARGYGDRYATPPRLRGRADRERPGSGFRREGRHDDALRDRRLHALDTR
jgi:hypothetical protein